MKQKKNSWGMIIIYSMIMAIMAMAVYAAGVATLQTPAANAILGGKNQSLNCSIDEMNISQGMEWYAVFYARSASTNSTSNVVVANVSNATNAAVSSDALYINTSFDPAILEDSNDYIFSCEAFNTTNASQDVSNTVTGITVDVTTPDAPSSIAPTSGTTFRNGTFGISSTVTAGKTTSCSLKFSGQSIAMTHSGSTCTYTTSNVADNSYEFSIIASDGTNISVTDAGRFTVDRKEGGGGGAFLAAQQQGRVVKASGNQFSIAGNKIGSWLNPFDNFKIPNPLAGMPKIISFIIGLAFIIIPIYLYVNGIILWSPFAHLLLAILGIIIIIMN